MSDLYFVTVRNYHDPILADIVISALHAAGIKTFPLQENNTGFPFSENHIEIKVQEKDVEIALEIIEYQENL